MRRLVDVVTELRSLAGSPAGRPAVVAVDGRSAGGKSTLAARLVAAVPGATAVHTDDVAWWESFFGWDALLVDGVLAPVHAGRQVTFRPPAWQARGRSGAVEVPAGATLVVVEGVGASRLSLAPWLDAAIWVQSDAHEARRRGLARDAAERPDEAEAIAFWDEWDLAEVAFLAQDQPWLRADLVLCGTPALAGLNRLPDPATEVVVGSR